jgi:hypothetical protein
VDPNGCFYYWRCQADDGNQVSFWTPMTAFLTLTIRPEMTNHVSLDPNFQIIEVIDPNSPVYGSSLKIRAGNDPNQEIFIGSVPDLPIPTGHIIPIGQWVYFGPDGFTFSEPSTIKLSYGIEELMDANIADPNGLINFNRFGIYQYQTKEPFLQAPIIEIVSQHDPNLRILEAEVNHLSLYVIGFKSETDYDPDDNPNENASGQITDSKSGGVCFISILSQKKFI